MARVPCLKEAKFWSGLRKLGCKAAARSPTACHAFEKVLVWSVVSGARELMALNKIGRLFFCPVSWR